MGKIHRSRTRRYIATALVAFLGALIAFFPAPPMLAQSTGSIVGQVTDLSGAVVPGAKVIVKGVETGVERPTTTTSEGYYSVPSLAPANYTVSAEITGFKRTVSGAMKVDTT